RPAHAVAPADLLALLARRPRVDVSLSAGAARRTARRPPRVLLTLPPSVATPARAAACARAARARRRRSSAGGDGATTSVLSSRAAPGTTVLTASAGVPGGRDVVAVVDAGRNFLRRRARHGTRDDRKRSDEDGAHGHGSGGRS